LGESARATGASPPRVHVPYRALYAAGYLAERFATATASRRRPLVTRLGAAFFGTDNRYAIAKAQRELGFQPAVGLREGIHLAAEWYRRGGHSGPVRLPGAGPDAEEVRVQMFPGMADVVHQRRHWPPIREEETATWTS
ncbi:MAG: hypothetical protein ACRDOE_20045, partial [Streptosporangiaceae bacterium]